MRGVSPTKAVHVVPDDDQSEVALKHVTQAPEYEKMLWIGGRSAGEVVILFALLHAARYRCTRCPAHVALDPRAPLHLVPDVLGQEPVQTLLVLASLYSLGARETKKNLLLES